MSSGADGSDPSTGVGPRTIPELPDREPPPLQAPPSPAPALPQREAAVASRTEAPVPAVAIVISRPGEEEVQTPDAKGASPQAGVGKATSTSASLTASKEAELTRADSIDNYEQCRAAKEEEVPGPGGPPMSCGVDGLGSSTGLDPGMIPELPDRELPLLQAPSLAPQQVVPAQANALVPVVTIVISRPGEEVQMPDAKGGSPACSPQAGDGKATATSVSLTASAAAKEAELARSDSFDDYEQCRVCQQKSRRQKNLWLTLGADVVVILPKHIVHALMFGFVLEVQTSVRYASRLLLISPLQRRKQVQVIGFGGLIRLMEGDEEDVKGDGLAHFGLHLQF